MNIYNRIEYIKDYLNGTAKKTIGVNASEDAKILGYLVVYDCRKMRGRNGVMYYYLFVYDNADLPVLCKILFRNGILPRVHTSGYFITPAKVVRFPVSSVIKDNAKVGFLRDVQEYVFNAKVAGDIQAKLDAVRQQIKSKVR